MHRILMAVALAFCASCASMAENMAQLQEDFSATLARNAEDQREALDAYRAETARSLADLHSKTISHEQHLANVKVAAEQRDSALQAAYKELLHEAKDDWRVFEERVEGDAKAAKEQAEAALVAAGNTIGGLTGTGPLGEVLLMAAGLFGLNARRNKTREKELENTKHVLRSEGGGRDSPPSG